MSNIFEEMAKKVIDRSLYGTKKDRRIKELEGMVIHLMSTIEVYGSMDWYEANPEWRPPVWLCNGEYTIDKRLEDIRRHSIRLREAATEARHKMYGTNEKLNPPPNY